MLKLNLIKSAQGDKMNREGVFGLILVALLLGGIVLFTRRPASYASAPQQYHSSNIRVVPEPRRYQNKEIREIEYNTENLPVKIIITRDFAIT